MQKSSEYRGVSYDKRIEKWRASYKGESLGIYDTEIEAAVAYDAEAEKDGGKTNFSTSFVVPKRLKSSSISSVYGVGYNQATKLWDAWLTLGDRENYLGDFNTELEAIDAIDKALETVLAVKVGR